MERLQPSIRQFDLGVASLRPASQKDACKMSDSKMQSLSPPQYDYQSSPLSRDERTFRLIRLRKEADDTVRYHLIPFHLTNAPAYEAISYRWASPELSCSIAIGDAFLRLTQSAFDILTDACLQPEEVGDVRYLWIDFVCINQSDHFEKDHQIPMMRDIYSGATKVIIYLGHAPDPERAHQFLLRLERFCKGRRKHGQEMGLVEGLVASLINPLEDQACCNAFRHVITREYWTRAWVVQEIISGKETVILYGGEYIDWHLVASVVSHLATHVDLMVHLFNALDKTHHAMAVLGLNCIFKIRYLQNLQSETSRLPLYDILLLTGHAKATVQQDKVNAFLSLSCDATHPDLQPNHQLSVGQVYQRTTIYSLGQGSLALLSLAGLANRKLHGSIIPDSPSWVADFSRPGITCQIDNPQSHYRAGGPSERMQVVVDKDLELPESNRLEVKGVIIGRIAAVSKLMSPQQSNLRTLDPSVGSPGQQTLGDWLRPKSDCHHEYWDQIGTHCPDPYLFPNGTSISRNEALWRTMVGNEDRDAAKLLKYPAPDQIGKYYETFSKLCKAQKAGNLESCANEISASDNTALYGLNHLTSLMGRRARQRRFVVTEKGHMGFASMGVQSGDVVCVLLGSNSPCVLRPNNEDGQDTMQLVCEAYIHGFMDGEVVDCDDLDEILLRIV